VRKIFHPRSLFVARNSKNEILLQISFAAEENPRPLKIKNRKFLSKFFYKKYFHRTFSNPSSMKMNWWKIEPLSDHSPSLDQKVIRSQGHEF
jgi:hypothetical protein